MANVGVDFILRARTALFTQGLASANNAVHELKKSLKSFDVGREGKVLKEALGVGGVIAAFKTTIDYARELRKSLEEAGKPVDENTASVARYGDALEQAVKTARELGVNSLSFFTKAGEAWGALINYARGYSFEQQKINENTEKAADAAEARLAKARKAMAEAGAQADKEYQASLKKNKMAAMSPEEQETSLAYELRDVNKKMSGMIVGSDAWKVQRAKAEELSGQINELEKKNQGEVSKRMREEDKDALDKDTAEAEALDTAAQKNKERDKKLIENFAPTVEQLAKKDVGGFFFNDNDPRIKARRALEQEDKARALFDRGDFKGGLAAAKKAQGLRQSLENQTSGSGALTPRAAEDAVHEALTDTNDKLDTLTKTVAGIIKAQK